MEKKYVYLVLAWNEPSPDWSLYEDNVIRAYLSEEDANNYVKSCEKNGKYNNYYEYINEYGSEYIKDYMDVYRKELF